MPKASEVKKGAIVGFKDQVYTIRHIDIRTPSSRGSNTLYKMKLQDVRTRQNLDHTFKGDDMLDNVDYSRREVSYSYQDDQAYIFMDNEDYTQYSLDGTDIQEQLGYLHEGLEGLFVSLIEGTPVSLQLPPSVVLDIAETAPAIKGASVTKRTKPATLSTGIEVQVPEYISSDERIKVNTETGEFISRA